MNNSFHQDSGIGPYQNWIVSLLSLAGRIGEVILQNIESRMNAGVFE